MLSWGDLKSDGVKEGGSIRWIRSSEVWWCVWGTRKRSFHIFSSCVIYFLSFLLIYNSHSTNAPFKSALFSAFGIFTRLCNHHYIIPEHSHYPKWNLLSSRLCLPIPVSPTRLCQPFICSWLYVFISCTWIHTICCLLRLASAEHVFKVHPRCSLRQHFISLHGWKIFRCVVQPISWWTVGLCLLTIASIAVLSTGIQVRTCLNPCFPFSWMPT